MHLVKFLGHPDQPYMKTLFSALSSKKSQVSHSILCVNNLSETHNIPYQKIGTSSNIFNVKTFGFICQQILFPKKQNIIFGSETLKNRVKLLIKWEQLIKSSVDVIHVHNLHMIPIDILRYLESKKHKMVVSLRGRDLVIETLDDQTRAIFLEKMRCFDSIHVNSQYLKQLAIARGVNPQKISTIYRGVEYNSYKKGDYNQKDMPKIDQPIHIISVGRLEWEKGQIYILDSIYRLKEKGVKISCDIYGEGRYREFLQYRIVQLGLIDDVKLMGYVKNEDLRLKYKNYHMAIQCSIYESLPNGLIEMCLHNLPCVISDVGGITEFITHGINGVTFDVKHPEQLDEAIVGCLKLDKEKLKSYNQELYDKFSFTKGVNQLNELYVKLGH